MSRNYTTQQVEDNNKYTQECKHIYHSFRIAEVKKTDVKEAGIPMFTSIAFILFLMAFIVVWVRIKIYGDMNGENSLIFIYLYMLIAVFFISLTVWVIFFIKIKKCWYKKDYHSYLYRDNNGLFSISIIEKDNNPTITQIVNCDEMFLFDGEEKEKIIWRKFERYSGIKQFTLSPNEVFSDADQGLIIYKHKLKKKIVKSDKVIYKFYNRQGLVLGAIHPHCLVIKNGVIQYAVAHYMRKHSYYGYNHTNTKHLYSHINDENIKIIFSKEFIENAKKAKFNLPQPSVNIIYESNE